MRLRRSTLSRYGYVMGQAVTPMPALKFGSTVIYLEQDVANVLDFYRRAFGFDTRFYDPHHEFGELETGGTSIAFATAKAYELMLPGSFQPPPAGRSSGTELAFITDDVPGWEIPAPRFRSRQGAG